MNWDKTFKKIENHFGFKLYDWQKDYISMKIDFIPVGGRGNGKTFAYILRHLLNYEGKIKNHKITFEPDPDGKYFAYWLKFPVDEYFSLRYVWHYRSQVINICRELMSIGIETCFN